MNPTEDMKAWDKINNVMYAHVGVSINGCVIYKDVDKFPETLVGEVGLDLVSILLKFPDKDSEVFGHPDIWSCDLITIDIENLKGLMLFVFHNGLSWNFKQVDVADNYIWSEEDFESVHKNWFSARTKRLCSIYDKEALDHLPEDVVSKLKEGIER